MADLSGGLRKMFRRCTASTSGNDAWVALGVVFFVLGVMGYSSAFVGVGVAFLAIGLARRHRQRSAE